MDCEGAFSHYDRQVHLAAVAQLHAMGVEVAMLTGDGREVAESVGGELGLDQVLVEVLPEHKVRRWRSCNAKTSACDGGGRRQRPNGQWQELSAGRRYFLGRLGSERHGLGGGRFATMGYSASRCRRGRSDQAEVACATFAKPCDV